MFIRLFISVGLLITTLCQAQKLSISPANWWVQMKTDKLVLVVENAPIGISDISINNSEIELIKHYPAANPAFHFIEIEIPYDIKAHTANIVFKTDFAASVSYPFRIYKRNERNPAQSLSSSDAIYQLIPDRFCNGNKKNDNIMSYFEKKDRLNPTGIHGGDINGILSKLDYIKDLGCTTLEILPVTESNLMMNSYKRLASTNFYKVDERLGNIGLYKQLIDSCQSLGLKFIQSFVLHQIGNKHPYFQQMIDTDFFHGTTYDFNSPLPDFSVLTDPYSPESVKKANRQSWNKPNFPTLNQENKLVRQLLIQQVIWWIETTGLRNLKIEQAARNTPQLIKELYSSLNLEYDDLTLVVDNQSPTNQGIYWENLTLDLPTFIVNYNYPSILSNAFSPYEDATKGTAALHKMQLQFAPSDLLLNINLLDNHLLNRAYTNADSDQAQLVMMLGHLLCSPGLPSIYYGTEWQMKGFKSKGISNLAKDFPGGWMNDNTNAFTGKGMSESQKRFYLQMTKLLNWRKENPDLFTGEFIHLLPQSDIYAFVRKSSEQTILVIINNSANTTYHFQEDDFSDIINNYNRCTDLITDDIYLKFKDIIVRNKSIAILTLQK
ncbi:cyclomaltodextrinase N-terminal domain-containing protein [Carboxylicivirga sp. A043]|uniref:alpha-amylase family glycosyl hydrolase n=1 Tax=Carboxylicivirga litoralis TaxID=2816963 RepID=UPI0021CAF029|nr:alpha-amylase family glycosyl hydrolase [Carboxylicivirga sp. A043]MCU4157240.1 cyclomaltodextrinase N-terminal domain-containing protein [Carboxylicivirga sp. A043]